MIALTVKELKTLKDKSIGLIRTKEAYPVLMKTRFGIHTLGMKFPIDVVVLDKDNKVVNIKEDMKPNTIFLWNPKFDTILELPIGTIKKYRIKIGSRIRLLY